MCVYRKQAAAAVPMPDGFTGANEAAEGDDSGTLAQHPLPAEKDAISNRSDDELGTKSTVAAYTTGHVLYE